MRLSLQAARLQADKTVPNSLCAVAISKQQPCVCKCCARCLAAGLQADVALPDSLCAVTIDNKVRGKHCTLVTKRHVKPDLIPAQQYEVHAKEWEGAHNLVSLAVWYMSKSLMAMAGRQ